MASGLALLSSGVGGAKVFESNKSGLQFQAGDAQPGEADQAII